jgi:hypothetical protein
MSPAGSVVPARAGIAPAIRANAAIAPVIPAKAGIAGVRVRQPAPAGARSALLKAQAGDSRLRGNDDNAGRGE